LNPREKNTWLSAKKDTLKGIIWLFLLRAWDQVLNAAVTIILARLLLPDDFGLIGMATIFIGLFLLLSDLGTGKAIIQKQDLGERALSSLFWFNILIGMISAGIVVFLSPFIATFFNQPSLQLLLCVLSLSFVILSFSVVQSALMQKELQFRKVAIITAVGILLGGAAGIFAAVVGLGVWALAIQYLTTCLISTVIYFIVSKWKPHFFFHWSDIREVWGFSIYLSGFNFSNYLARNSDNLIVGRFLGSAALGNYALAYRMMVYPISNLTSIIQQGVLPLFSRVQDDERLSRAFIKSSRYQAFLITPAMLGLAVVSREFILGFFGEKWSAAIPVLAILCLVAVFQPYVMYFTVVLVSKGMTRALFLWSLASTILLIACFLIGIRWGIVGVALLYLIAQVAIALISMPILFRLCKISLLAFLRNLSLPFIASLFMACMVWVVRFELVSFTHLHPLAILGICIGAGLLVYGLILFLFRKMYWTEMVSDLKDLFIREKRE
jgi:O-antigen/teichoic acid export membrane protein